MKTIVIGAFLSIATFAHAAAEPLVYTPRNPSFGGNSFNSAHLLGIAAAQKDPEKFERPSAIDNFEDIITSRLLSQIALEITDQIYGENAQESGTFQFGETSINFDRIGENLNIVIVDPSGVSTSIVLPAPVF